MADSTACTETLSIELDIEGLSPYLQDWYKDNSCTLIKLVGDIDRQVKAYNVIIDSYNAKIRVMSATDYNELAKYLGDSDQYKLKVTYNTDALVATIESMLPLAGTDTIDMDLGEEGRSALAPIQAVTELFGGDFGWTINKTIEKNLSKIAPDDVEVNGVFAASPVKSILKDKAHITDSEASREKKLSKSITESARELKELWDQKKEVAQTAGGAEIAWRASSDSAQEAIDKALEDFEVARDERQPIDVVAAPPGPKKINFERRAFSEQCFLLAKIVDLAAYKKDVIDMTPPQQKKLPYYPDEEAGNASLMVEGDPYAFVNRLTQHGAQSAFFNMKTEEISALQPMIRLFKIIEDEGQKPLQQEFMFDSHASRRDVESLFNDTSKRGFGVGIKEFTFTYDGSTPFAAKKSIKAQLKIFASSFDELLVDRGGYMYADLALKTGKMKTSQAKLEESASTSCQTIEDVQANLDKLNFRLKAVVGWAPPSGDKSIFTTTTETGRRKVIDAINESYVTLNLTPTIHEFSIDEMGRVNFTINYLAYIEDFFDQSEFDIFYDRNVLARQTARELTHEILSTRECGAAKISAWKETLAERGIVRKDKFTNMQSLMERLGAFGGEGESKIRYINVGKEDLENYNRKGPFYQAMDVAAAMKDRPSDTEAVSAKINKSFFEQVQTDENKEKKSRSGIKIEGRAGGPLEKTISFFYVSDLTDIILKGIEDRIKALMDSSFWGIKGEPGERQSTKAHDDGSTSVMMSAGVGASTDAADAESIEWKGLGAVTTLAELRVFRDKRISKIRRFAEEYKRFRLLLGPLELVNPKNNGERKEVCFGDIPISTKYFMGWLSDKLTAREQTQYNLSTFLKEFFNHIVRDFLNNDQCFTINTKQKAVLNEAIVTSYRDTKYDEITQWIISKPTGIKGLKHYSRAYAWLMSQPILNISGPHGRNSTSPIVDGGVANEINYMVFSAARVQPKELQKGSRVQDEARGVFHYLIGRPRGIVKSINLVKVDSKYLKIVRFQQDGFDGLQQLREVYNAEIDCFANVKAFPGTYIFVDPRGFAPNTPYYAATDPTDPKPSSKRPNPMDLTQYGIGGYCMVYRSEHTFAPGKADSKITAAWVAAIDPDNEDCSPPEPSSTGDGSTEKTCKKPKTPAPTPARRFGGGGTADTYRGSTGINKST